MPNRNAHINQAHRNEDFYKSFDLKTTPYSDWVVNGIFYSALHYIDSYLAEKGLNPDSHGDRKALINGDPNLGTLIYFHYRPLEDDSRDARYEMKVFTPEEISSDIIPHLVRIKAILKGYIPQIQ